MAPGIGGARHLPQTLLQGAAWHWLSWLASSPEARCYVNSNSTNRRERTCGPWARWRVSKIVGWVTRRQDCRTDRGWVIAWRFLRALATRTGRLTARSADTQAGHTGGLQRNGAAHAAIDTQQCAVVLLPGTARTCFGDVSPANIDGSIFECTGSSRCARSTRYTPSSACSAPHGGFRA